MKNYYILFLLSTIIGFNTLSNAQSIYTLRKETHDYISASNKDFYFAMLAEIKSKDKIATVFWPCLMGEGFASDKILMLLFEKENDNWIYTDLLYTNQEGSKVKFKGWFENDSTEIIRSSGFPLDKLAEHLLQSSQNINKMIADTNFVGAVNNIELFFSAFSFEEACFDSKIVATILKGISSIDITDIKIDGNNGTATLEIFYNDKATEQSIFLKKTLTNKWVITAIE